MIQVNRIPDTAGGVLLPAARVADKRMLRDAFSGALYRQYHTQVLPEGIKLPAGAQHLVVRNLDNREISVNGTTVRSGESYFQDGKSHLLPEIEITGSNYQIIVLY